VSFKGRDGTLDGVFEGGEDFAREFFLDVFELTEDGL
jgi:hypothetical protein